MVRGPTQRAVAASWFFSHRLGDLVKGDIFDFVHPIPKGKKQMKPQATSNGDTPKMGLRATTAVCRDRGISDTTMWRLGKAGLVRLVNIYGKSYVDLESLAIFDERAKNGEFARKPVGAAKKSAEARAAKEGK
jgi:hypothetical protein